MRRGTALLYRNMHNKFVPIDCIQGGINDSCTQHRPRLGNLLETPIKRPESEREYESLLELMHHNSDQMEARGESSLLFETKLTSY
jgi:hypothetical protein